MLHYMKLKNSPFNMIESGKKTIELRLYDEKRRKINIGDSIIFTNLSYENERLAVTVKALYRYASFRDLFEEIPLEKCGISTGKEGNTIEDAVKRMRTFYSEEKEKQYGVLGIRIILTDLNSILLEQEQIKASVYDQYFPDGMK